MKPYTSTTGTTITINVKLLFACGFGWTAWAVWPGEPEWWGMGVVSITFGLCALSLAIEALKLMAKVHGQEKALRDYTAQGHAPKSSEMASTDQLRDAGMR